MVPEGATGNNPFPLSAAFRHGRQENGCAERSRKNRDGGGQTQTLSPWLQAVKDRRVTERIENWTYPLFCSPI
jgi:hypothetical protein